MKKNYSLIPFILLAAYYVLIGKNEAIDFNIKIGILVAIILVSGFILYQKYSNKQIQNSKIYILGGALILSCAMFYFNWI